MELGSLIRDEEGVIHVVVDNDDKGVIYVERLRDYISDCVAVDYGEENRHNEDIVGRHFNDFIEGKAIVEMDGTPEYQ